MPKPTARTQVDLPDTVIFDGRKARDGYPLNTFFASLGTPANRERFQQDPEPYMDDFPLTEEQRRYVRERNWRGLLVAGGNIFFIYKLAALDGLSMQHVAAAMAGIPIDQYKSIMKSGGRTNDA